LNGARLRENCGGIVPAPSWVLPAPFHTAMGERQEGTSPGRRQRPARADHLPRQPGHPAAGIVPARHCRAEPADQAAAVVGYGEGQHQKALQDGGRHQIGSGSR
jgi:hypothetical protein